MKAIDTGGGRRPESARIKEAVQKYLANQGIIQKVIEA